MTLCVKDREREREKEREREREREREQKREGDIQKSRMYCTHNSFINITKNIRIQFILYTRSIQYMRLILRKELAIGSNSLQLPIFYRKSIYIYIYVCVCVCMCVCVCV